MLVVTGVIPTAPEITGVGACSMGSHGALHANAATNIPLSGPVYFRGAGVGFKTRKAAIHLVLERIDKSIRQVQTM